MNNIKCLLLAFIAFFLIINAEAATITSTEYTNGKVTINGAGEGEIQVVLFGLDNSPIYMGTTPAENGAFSITLPQINGLTEGSYAVKASDYDGTNVANGTVEITSEVNPQTLDSVSLYIFIGVGCLTGAIIMGGLVYKANKKTKK